MKRADQILAEGMVHAHLAADGAVDLREQGRRHLDQLDAAQVRRGDEARHVADDAAADGDDAGAAIGLQLDERLVRARRGGELLVLLPIGKEDRFGPRHRLRQRLAVQFPHERAGDEELSRGRSGRLFDQPAQLRRQAMFDVDGIGVRPDGNVNAEHLVSG